ncbi:putative MFS family arabinose efflux permease [Microbacterium phyllosphaerae]|uniref:MFS family arabinose efflux permease n=1 Tax=Microbacterium phyllosphaerae TaxID=124798 RepID=A0ABS4WQ00_9MICO|nr:MFS transporter [Microbacterium phyllosphaerae]MBP2378213.1 putative MFS family arabinose efflux permease [Microbacterium phyllosphaerae]
MTHTAATATKTSWMPLVSLFLAQVLMSFNVAALPISLGGMVSEFGVPPTVASTTIVMYGLAVAALVMTGAKLGQRVGWVLIFRVVIVLFAASSVLMIVSPSVGWAIAGQAVAGAAAAIIVPSIVALIAENYRGAQQATAIGAIGSARAISGVTAFLIGGTLGTLVGWRPMFFIVFGIAVVVFAFSFTLRGDRGDASIRIDLVASLLIGAAIVLLTLGFNNLNGWGAVAATDAAPFSILGLSPAPAFIVVGIVLGQIFFVWTRRRMAEGKVPLIDLSVLDSSKERAAVYAMFIVVALEACVNFTIPLYIQIVQGRTPFDTSLAMMPFNLTVFITATLVVRFYKRYPPRVIGVFGFILTTVALVWLSFVVNNNWETLPTILGLIVFGIGQGALVTLVFNVLVTAAPAELAGDVGSLRGTTQNLASAVGTALAGALLVSLLGLSIGRAVVEHPELPPALVAQVDMDNLNFVSNDDLRAALEQTDATPDQIDAAVAVNEESRLGTLRLGLLLLAGLSAVAILPASRLPKYKPEEIPDPSPTPAGD